MNLAENANGVGSDSSVVSWFYRRFLKLLLVKVFPFSIIIS